MADQVNARELLGLRILHVGINMDGEDAAWALAGEFTDKMGLVSRDNDLTIFCSDLIEIMKNDGPGSKGHIALGCNNLEESIAFFEARGLHVDHPVTSKYDPTGALRVAYFEEQIGGFAFHLKEVK